MAKAPQGPFGSAHGSLGNLTFYNLNGQAVVRQKAEFHDNPSEAQLVVRSGIRTLMGFLKKVKPFIKTGFINESRGTVKSYFNVATSYNLPSSMKIEAGQYVMDYPKLKLSSGAVPLPENIQVALEAQGLKYSWDLNLTLDWKMQQDQAMMLAYFPTENESIIEISGARRSAGIDFLRLPNALMDKAMELYLAFVSDDRLQVSNSVYLGRIH